MLLASSGADFGALLFALAIVLLAAKFCGELVERFGIPSVLGEIVAGILIGPHALNLVDIEHAYIGSSIGVLAELGVLLLLLQVGMEMDLAELGKVGTSSLAVAVIGVAAPFATGTLAAIALGQDTKTAIFVGAALTATSVGITARVFGDLGALSSTESRVVLGAAVADDVLGLVILTVVVKVVTGGSVGVGTVASTLGLAVLFLVVSGIVGLGVVPKALDLVDRIGRSNTTVTVLAFALLFAFAGFADLAKLAPIIGAFMAGLALGASRHQERLHHDTAAIGQLLIPIFFVQIGLDTDLGVMGDPKVIGIAMVLFVLAVVGKLVAAWGIGGLAADKILIGIGMVPRGEVGLIFASIGLADGVLDNELYASLLIVMLLTTLVTPPALRWRILANTKRAGGTTPVPAPPASDEPLGDPQRWLEVRDGAIELVAAPPVSGTPAVVLTAAELARHARPGGSFLQWIDDHRSEELEWARSDTDSLLELLRRPDARSFRLLEVTGVLERTLPQVAEALERRRRDPNEIDPSRAMRFSTVDRLAELRYSGQDQVAAAWASSLRDPDSVVLAALSYDVCGTEEAHRAVLLDRLVGPAESANVNDLTSDGVLLARAARHPENFDEGRLRRIAEHIESEDRLHEASLLALAMDPQESKRHLATDQLVRALRPLVLERAKGGALVDARRAEAQRMTSRAAADLVRTADPAYVLSTAPEIVARRPPPWRGPATASPRPSPRSGRTSGGSTWRSGPVSTVRSRAPFGRSNPPAFASSAPRRSNGPTGRGSNRSRSAIPRSRRRRPSPRRCSNSTRRRRRRSWPRPPSTRTPCRVTGSSSSAPSTCPGCCGPWPRRWSTSRHGRRVLRRALRRTAHGPGRRAGRAGDAGGRALAASLASQLASPRSAATTHRPPAPLTVGPAGAAFVAHLERDRNIQETNPL
ncbi:MAG: cation:proton antiporter [Ilumatobacteraceae bacterium]